MVTLVSAALVATVVRLFLYLTGGKKDLTEDSIANMGLTVILLEVCIVMLRFFTTFQMMERFNKYVTEKNEFVTFTIMGMAITFLWTMTLV